MLEKFKKLKSSNEMDRPSLEVDLENVPGHVAIIMDGNGRWANNKGLPRIAGHREGMKVVNKIVSRANKLGVKVLTLYAFSTENWKRPKPEVEFLMKLPELYLGKELPKLKKENVRVRLMGCPDELPAHTLRAVQTATEETKENTGLILNFALNYGSRVEIIRAIRTLASQVQDGKISPEEITEEHLEQHLMTDDLNDPDLLIRTSGELRLSNFMLWQLAYSEFWFTDVLWPDFTEEHFEDAIRVYQKRGRRYGGV